MDSTISYFTLTIPGLAPIKDFQQFNDNLLYDLINPGAVSVLSFSLNIPLPENMAASLYYSIPPFENLSFIGAIANSRPSDIFHTGFGLNSDIINQPLIKLVIRGEPMDERLRTLVENVKNNDLQKEYAKKVAFNLYNYMSSFELPNGMQGMQGYTIVPNNFLEKWLIKFNEKYRLDPLYIMKTSQN